MIEYRDRNTEQWDMMIEDNNNAMFAEERKRRIVAYVNRMKRVTVKDLCSEFDVSSATIRNDLNKLHDKGLLRRTHGGAIANIQTNFEPITNEKNDRFLSEKQSIARAALQFVQEGDCIAIDAGTTCYEFAKLLGSFKKLRVVTYDLNTAAWLDANTDVSLYLFGGEVRRGHHYMIGNAATEFYSKLNVDVFIMAANGISVRAGLTTPQLDTALIKERIIRNSRKNILLADSSKLENISFAKFADLDEVDVFVTDQYADNKALESLQKNGVSVYVAPPETAGGPDPDGGLAGR